MIKIDEDSIEVVTSNFVKHDGYIYRIGFLLRILHSLKDQLAYKKLCFTFPDGEPIVFSSFETVINCVQQKYDIPPNRLIVKTVDVWPRYNNPKATSVMTPNGFFAAVESGLRDVSGYQLRDDAAIFGGIYGRFSTHRFLMAHFLETQLSDSSFVIFQPNESWSKFELDPIQEFFTDQYEWALTRQEKNVTDISKVNNGCLNYRVSLKTYPDLWSKYLLEIVAETNVTDHGWFTEKTLRCLKTGKPFILLGTPGQLQQLRRMGFKTFDPVIDESYDQIDDLDDRFDAICNEIKRLSAIDKSTLIQQLYPIAEFNALNYTSIIQNYQQNFHQLS